MGRGRYRVVAALEEFRALRYAIQQAEGTIHERPLKLVLGRLQKVEKERLQGESLKDALRDAALLRMTRKDAPPALPKMGWWGGPIDDTE